MGSHISDIRAVPVPGATGADIEGVTREIIGLKSVIEGWGSRTGQLPPAELIEQLNALTKIKDLLIKLTPLSDINKTIDDLNRQISRQLSRDADVSPKLLERLDLLKGIQEAIERNKPAEPGEYAKWFKEYVLEKSTSDINTVFKETSNQSPTISPIHNTSNRNVEIGTIYNNNTYVLPSDMTRVDAGELSREELQRLVREEEGKVPIYSP